MRKIILLSCLIFIYSINLAIAEEQHEHNEAIKLTEKNIALAGIKVTRLIKKPMTHYLIVPGEIIPNQNQIAIVAPRISAQVVKRLVNVGQKVESGQPMVELSSIAVASAQSQLLINAREWQRLKKLGTNIVTKKSYEEAEIKYREAYGKLLAYGLSKKQIDDFITAKQANKADGNFTLLAPIAGTVTSANVILGQMLEPGTKIYEINNESSLWVDALLSADNQYQIQEGTTAIISTGQKTINGTVLQVHHQLDKTTRTQIVRIAINNTNDQFHAGEFVTCHIAIGKTEPVYSVPSAAVLQDEDGDKLIYVESKPNEFTAQPVNVLYQQEGEAVINGIKDGLKVVTNGAFFINSEAQKSGFDAHNH